jgi:hypothetical protein
MRSNGKKHGYKCKQGRLRRLAARCCCVPPRIKNSDHRELILSSRLMVKGFQETGSLFCFIPGSESRRAGGSQVRILSSRLMVKGFQETGSLFCFIPGSASRRAGGSQVRILSSRPTKSLGISQGFFVRTESDPPVGGTSGWAHKKARQPRSG